MFRSKKLRKMTAKLMAVMMCAALIGTTAPITAAEEDAVLLNADFEPTSESVLKKDFEDGKCETTKFEGYGGPIAEIITDENNNNNKYARIDATRYVWATDGKEYPDNCNGGYLFDDSKKIENGNWTISFDFNVLSGGMLDANVSLAKTGLNGGDAQGIDNNVYKQFRLLGIKPADDTTGTAATLLVNKAALNGDQPELNRWYHYEMKLNKSASTYTVKITDITNSSFEATQSGEVSQTFAFEGLMIGAGMIVNMDNISITGEKINAPEFVKKSADSYLTYEIADGAAHIKSDVTNWRYGAFMFKSAMGTSSKYEIKFDFKAQNIASQGAVYLTDSNMGGGSEPAEFELLGLYDGYFCAGIYNFGSDWVRYTTPILAADLSDAEGNDKDKWFTYEMVGDRSTGAWTATIAEKGNSARTKTESGNNFPKDKAIDRMMFGTACDIYIDNILVQEKLAKPSMSDERVKFLDKNGAQINCSNADVSLLTDKISLDFGTRLKEDTINNNITLVKSVDSGAVSFDYEMSGTAVILKNLNLEPTTAYTLTVSSGITGKDGQKLDKTYTLNMTTGANVTTMRLANVKIGDSVVEDFAGLTDGKATVVINSTNTTADPIEAVLIMAYYDNNNRLLLADAQAVNGAAQSAADVNAAVTIAKPEGCTKVKVMLWNSLGNTKPLSAILEF